MRTRRQLCTGLLAAAFTYLAVPAHADEYAGTYYAKVYYEHTPKQTFKHHFLSSATVTHGGATVSFGLYLHDDHTFELDYTELGSQADDRGGRRVDKQLRHRGRWRLSGNDLLLGDVAKLSRTSKTMRGKPVVTFTLHKKLGDPNAVGASTALTYKGTSSPPCRVKPDLAECR